MQARARFVRSARNPLRRSCVSSARKMQARVRFAGRPRNPLPRSCVSSARNAGESAICPVRAQPSAEIVRVERARECDLPAARATLCGDRARRVRKMQARVRFAGCARNPLRRSRVERAKRRRECDLLAACATLSALCGDRAVECAKYRRECDLPAVRLTLCGDRACRAREMQARVRFAGCVRNPFNPLRRWCVSSARNTGESAICPCSNPLRRSCVSSARNAGESVICRLRAQPSAEIVRVECAKCRRECDLPAVRATLCGDRACRQPRKDFG